MPSFTFSSTLSGTLGGQADGYSITGTRTPTGYTSTGLTPWYTLVPTVTSTVIWKSPNYLISIAAAEFSELHIIADPDGTLGSDDVVNLLIEGQASGGTANVVLGFLQMSKARPFVLGGGASAAPAGAIATFNHFVTRIQAYHSGASSIPIKVLPLK